jgi:hypothetical protein
MANRSSRYGIRPMAALAHEAATTIGPWCANVHLGPEDQRLQLRPDIRPPSFRWESGSRPRLTSRRAHIRLAASDETAPVKLSGRKRDA